ncbi:hypothetical protein QA640_38120 [Bradyrhizobium sp. CB82]|uniref:hypothetical protein n=1 Tax=Bradyrhizobium sp. CB82 TaxID=3039159 RepID=UPI0024B20CFC|nr:hypothetical protein [Bradyrhizobium sp. CB82]WFU40012.1 hypothetical protein QA640_38120 [Bradyrhizobium sp. CB82]
MPVTRGQGITNRSKAKSQNAGKRGPTHRFPAKSNTVSTPLLVISQAIPHSSRTTKAAMKRFMLVEVEIDPGDVMIFDGNLALQS